MDYYARFCDDLKLRGYAKRSRQSYLRAMHQFQPKRANRCRWFCPWTKCARYLRRSPKSRTVRRADPENTRSEKDMEGVPGGVRTRTGKTPLCRVKNRARMRTSQSTDALDQRLLVPRRHPPLSNITHRLNQSPYSPNPRLHVENPPQEETRD